MTFAQPSREDPLPKSERFILEKEIMDSDALKTMRAEIAAEVDQVIATAQREQPPVGAEEDWCAISRRELTDHIREHHLSRSDPRGANLSSP
jgi:TPP-dependent pyruvate/acetoin dehydrogenase alpha subunit